MSVLIPIAGPGAGSNPLRDSGLLARPFSDAGANFNWSPSGPVQGGFEAALQQHITTPAENRELTPDSVPPDDIRANELSNPESRSARDQQQQEAARAGQTSGQRTNEQATQGPDRSTAADEHSKVELADKSATADESQIEGHNAKDHVSSNSKKTARVVEKDAEDAKKDLKDSLTALQMLAAQLQSGSKPESSKGQGAAEASLKTSGVGQAGSDSRSAFKAATAMPSERPVWLKTGASDKIFQKTQSSKDGQGIAEHSTPATKKSAKNIKHADKDSDQKTGRAQILASGQQAELHAKNSLETDRQAAVNKNDTRWHIKDERPMQAALDNDTNSFQQQHHQQNKKDEAGSQGHRQQRQVNTIKAETQSVSPAGDAPQANSGRPAFLEQPLQQGLTQRSQNQELMNQLVERARVNIKADGSSIAHIRMNPKELGQLSLHLHMQENRLQGRLIVENEGAFKLVKEELDHLQRELKQQGIQVDSLQIRLRESQHSQMNMHSGQDQFQAWLGQNSAEQKSAENSEKQHAGVADQVSRDTEIQGEAGYERELSGKRSERIVDLSV
ncbi:MAG: flagellar hook-length control protein FliK [Leptospiraceae bacterium]|nr:flagellar hook-length control protein FliK [Leptospiraceae bacterium]